MEVALKSTPELYRSLRGQDRALDLALRQAVRARLRDVLDPSVNPPGRGWLYGQHAAPCPFCEGTLYDVRVPRYEATVVFFCAVCHWCHAEPLADFADGSVAAQLGLTRH
jgi:hypothetical protein